MSPRTIADSIQRKVPLLRSDQPVRDCVDAIVAAGLPALPVVDDAGKLEGIFGEREFIGAIFPGYLGQLKYAAFVTKAADEVLEKRASCLGEPVSAYTNTEHIDVGPNYSDAQLAEVFLHHRVLIIPVVEERRVVGVVSRSDFFRALAERAPG